MWLGLSPLIRSTAGRGAGKEEQNVNEYAALTQMRMHTAEMKIRQAARTLAARHFVPVVEIQCAQRDVLRLADPAQHPKVSLRRTNAAGV